MDLTAESTFATPAAGSPLPSVGALDSPAGGMSDYGAFLRALARRAAGERDGHGQAVLAGWIGALVILQGELAALAISVDHIPWREAGPSFLLVMAAAAFAGGLAGQLCWVGAGRLLRVLRRHDPRRLWASGLAAGLLILAYPAVRTLMAKHELLENLDWPPWIVLSAGMLGAGLMALRLGVHPVRLGWRTSLAVGLVPWAAAGGLALWPLAGESAYWAFQKTAFTTEFMARTPVFRPETHRMKGHPLKPAIPEPPALAAAVSGDPASMAAASRPRVRNIAVIMIDTLRADHVGAWGYPRNITPNLDRFAANAVLFERAFAQHPQTWRSVPSMLSGRLASGLRMTDERYARVLPENEMMAEVFSRHGLFTAAWVSHWLLLPERGISQGFQHVNHAVVTTDKIRMNSKEIAGPVNETLLPWVREQLPGKDGFFLFVHYYDCHSGYLRHAGFPHFGDSPRDRYDHEIAYTDHHAGELIRTLEAAPFAGETAIFITSDHGEGFGDHGYQWHGKDLYNDQIHVPLLVRVPGVAPRRVKHPVALLDMAPTWLELLGIPRPEGLALAGYSLTPFFQPGREWERPPVFSQQVGDAAHFARRTVIEGRYKLYHNQAFKYFRLFDIEQDYHETRNLVDSEPALRERLLGVLNALDPAGGE
ncbi:MAG: hypothetical protein GMKNLPBB_02577 [Myxococcota bacterium]|nr:hypothetical protein [Myxococcota bacterium]